MTSSEASSSQAAGGSGGGISSIKSWIWLPIVLIVLSIGVLIFVNVNAYRQRKIQKAADAKLERYRKGLVGEDEMIYSDEENAGVSEDVEEMPEEEHEDFYIDDRYFDDDFNMNNESSDAQQSGYDDYNDMYEDNNGYNGYDNQDLIDNKSDSVKKMKKRIDDNPFV